MEKSAVSLFELNQLIRSTLKREIGNSFWVIAEILEMQVNRSGHCYLELIEKSEKDNQIKARAQGTIWAHQFRMLKPYFETTTKIPFSAGIKILMKVNVEFHELYGLSLNISDIDPAYTLGDLARKKEEVIQRLKAEGVFDMNRELSLPDVPQRIAIISSDTAAGFGDFINTLRFNSYGYSFSNKLFPAIMQGEESVRSILQALDDIYEREMEFDCIVLIRGGGSQADLDCFNNYDLVYHITQFPLPVLTGIGHERDESVADMVAYRSLKTPTAVAEFLIEKVLRFDMYLTGLHDRLSSLVEKITRENMVKLHTYASDLKNFSNYLIEKRNEAVLFLEKTIRREVNTVLNRQNDRIRAYNKNLELVHPETILARGYSITLVNGRSILKSGRIKTGDPMETIFHRGKVLSTIREYLPEIRKSKPHG